MRTGNKGIELIKHFEGCELEAYKCPAGVWTIGYGHIKGVHEGMKITEMQAEEMNCPPTLASHGLSPGAPMHVRIFLDPQGL